MATGPFGRHGRLVTPPVDLAVDPSSEYVTTHRPKTTASSVMASLKNKEIAT